MLRVIVQVIRRDLLLAVRQKADFLNTLFFFVVIVTMVPLGIGPEPNLLRAIAPGVVWVAALLASMLSLARLFNDDFHDGTLEQLLLASRPLCRRNVRSPRVIGRPPAFFSHDPAAPGRPKADHSIRSQLQAVLRLPITTGSSAAGARGRSSERRAPRRRRWALMISVTRLDGTPMIVNADQITWIEFMPDTVISLMNGEKLIVREPPETIVERVRNFKPFVLYGGRRTVRGPVPVELARSGEGR